MICKQCGRSIKSLGVASHRAMHYRKRIAAQLAESTQHSAQHRQPKICPKCGGHGVRDRIGISGTRRCHTCNGTGKLRASA